MGVPLWDRWWVVRYDVGETYDDWPFDSQLS
jgi:hypothetical protein